jgi:hypothetical protein
LLASAVDNNTALLAEQVATAQSILREKHARRALTDIWFWLTHCTKTRDEQDRDDPNKPFPDEIYLKTCLEIMASEKVAWYEKSRTMMLTWAACAFRAHEGFTTPQQRHVFQAPDEIRAVNCINYIKWLWENSLPELKAKWPLKREMGLQNSKVLEMANGTIFQALAGGAHKIRSLHPSTYTMDEGAFVEDGADCYDAAMAAKPLSVLVISSAKPGWFRDATIDAEIEQRQMPQGMLFRRSASGAAVVRVHYSADPAKRGDWAARERATYARKANWDLEMEIKYDAKSGTLVYPEFDPSVHIVPDAMIPKRGCLFMAADPHPRTPHAFLWVLIDRNGDWWIYRELWPSKSYGSAAEVKDGDRENVFTTRQYCEAIATLEGNRLEFNRHSDSDFGTLIESGEVIYDRFMDQAAKGFSVSGEGQQYESYWTRYNQYGFQFKEPYKIHQAGEDRIRELMDITEIGEGRRTTRLHIAQSCKELALEFQRYRYRAITDIMAAKSELPQMGVDKRSHLLDCLRYIATSNATYIREFESERCVR